MRHIPLIGGQLPTNATVRIAPGMGNLVLTMWRMAKMTMVRLMLMRHMARRMLGRLSVIMRTLSHTLHDKVVVLLLLLYVMCWSKVLVR